MSRPAFEELTTIEEYFQFFQLDYDPEVVRHQRIHLLRLFHQQIQTIESPTEDHEYRKAFERAYCLLKRQFIPAFENSPCTDCNKCDSTD